MANKPLFTQSQLIATTLGADTNRDGKFTADEINALVQKASKSHKPAEVIAAQELSSGSATGTFSQPFEYLTRNSVMQEVVATFRDYDQNKNGAISQSEFDFSQLHFWQANAGNYGNFMKDNAAKYR